MIVFGDTTCDTSPLALLAELHSLCRSLPNLPVSLARHSRVTSLLIQTGRLGQGLLDAAQARRGYDEDDDVSIAWTLLATEGARLFLASWRGQRLHIDRYVHAGDALGRLALPRCVQVKIPEGYAHYAVFPECYAEAAPADESLVVLGLRSIGTSLAPVVAAASGSAHPFVTVRPVGPPFDRRLELGVRLSKRLLSDAGATFAIVDEGPGLSGSSFAGAAEWLEERGVPRARIRFIPSHSGPPGACSPDRHSERWRTMLRESRSFDDVLGWHLFYGAEDISGGRWRVRQGRPEAEWPSAQTLQERRKFLLSTPGGPVLARFAGLGPEGELKLHLSEQLSDIGFVPRALGLRHGFLLERWLEDAVPLDRTTFERRRLVDRIATYIRFRQQRFRVSQGTGPEALLSMAAHNVHEALGKDIRSIWQSRLSSLGALWQPIAIDGRMHRWEWLVLNERLIKTDAVDHHAAHDCVGAVDAAWDVAGALFEHGLSRDELLPQVERPALLVDFCEVAYLAFQWGRSAMAERSHAAINPAEAARWRTERERYAALLRASVSR